MGVLRAVSIIAVFLSVAASACAFLPQAAQFQPYLLYAAPALGFIALVAILAWRRPEGDNGRATAKAAQPMSAPTKANQAEAEIVSFLATLQAKGRLVDFLMDDIKAYDDAQVGAAARVVHAGCKAVLDEYFRIHPVREATEGSRVQLAADYSADDYRLLGKVTGRAPFSGVLIHHGWKTDSVKLPTIIGGSADRLPAIAPAEVELK